MGREIKVAAVNDLSIMDCISELNFDRCTSVCPDNPHPAFVTEAFIA